MTGPVRCDCGDSECPSCGTLQGTRQAGRCNCENLGCPHGQRPCDARADAGYLVLYIGQVCSGCFRRMPAEYRCTCGEAVRSLGLHSPSCPFRQGAA